MTRASTALRVSEVILKTARLVDLRAWYRLVLDVEPSIEHDPDTVAPVEGGPATASGMRLCFFELNEDFPYTQTLGLFEVPGTALLLVETSPGLHHVQLHAGTVASLVTRFEALAVNGIRPARSMNHGISTSFYYADPDGNTVELTANNFASLSEHRAYLASARFRANPAGELIDPDAFRHRFRAGEPIEKLREFTR